MKNKIFIPLVIILFTLLISCDKSSHKNDEVKCIVLEPHIHYDEYESWSSLADEFTDFEIIQLDKKHDCLLSVVDKMIVTDSCMYFFNREPIQKIYSFSLNGQYRNCIGNKGHAKGEYMNIQNIAVSSSGDTIIMIDIPNVNLYDGNGKYLSTLPIKNRSGIEDVFWADNGLFLGYFHRQNTGVLSFYDKHLEKKEDIIRTSVAPIGYPFGTANSNFIQKDGDIMFCLDGLTSSFYAINLKNSKNVTKYSFKLNDILTEEKARASVDVDEVFHLYSYQIYNGIVRGVIAKSTECYDFKFSLTGKTVELMHHKDFDYSFDCCNSGFFYKIVSAGELLDFMDKSKVYMEPIRTLLGNALSELEGKISLTDNYYVIKMRLKV